MTFNYGGYAGKALRIDLTKGKVTKETQSKQRVEKYLGGEGQMQRYYSMSLTQIQTLYILIIFYVFLQDRLQVY